MRVNPPLRVLVLPPINLPPIQNFPILKKRNPVPAEIQLSAVSGKATIENDDILIGHSDK